MKSKTVKRYYCDFCRKGFFGRSKAMKHESHCYKNPARVPWLGEITSVRSEGGDIAWDWPGAGKIWDGKEWRNVPHYEQDGSAEYWPCVDGTPLKDFRAAERIAVLFAEGVQIESGREFVARQSQVGDENYSPF